jgi:hypothetical protein
MIFNAIYSILKGVTEITDVVGLQIYPEIAPQGAQMPFIVNSITSIIPETTKDGVSKLDLIEFKIIAFGNDVDELLTLERSTRNALDRFSGIVGGSNIDSINFSGFESGYDNTANVFISETDYKIREKL